MKKILVGIIMALATLPAFAREFEEIEAKFNIDFDYTYEEVPCGVEENFFIFSKDERVIVLFNAEENIAYIKSKGELSKKELKSLKDLIQNGQYIPLDTWDFVFENGLAFNN